MVPVTGVILFFSASPTFYDRPEPFPKNMYVFPEKHLHVSWKTCTSFSSFYPPPLSPDHPLPNINYSKKRPINQ